MNGDNMRYRTVASLNLKAAHELIPNDKKYRTELGVLHDTVIYGMNQTGYLKHIISKLDGLLIHDTCIKCPDLIIKGKNNDRVIGVEHMHVDSTAFKTNKWKSSVKKYTNTISDIIETTLTERASSGNSSDTWQFYADLTDAIKNTTITDINMYYGLLDRLEKTYANSPDNKKIKTSIELIKHRIKQNATFSNMFGAFKYSYDKHLGEVDAYMQNLDTINKGSKQKELMFLIDINMDNDPFYLVHTESKQGYDGTWFFKELVDHIKASDKLSVSYIIISIYRKKDVIDVIAINTKRVESSLNKQDKRLYPYIGLSDPESASKEDVRAFKRSGMKHVFMSSESGFITDHNSLEQLDQYNISKNQGLPHTR